MLKPPPHAYDMPRPFFIDCPSPPAVIQQLFDDIPFYAENVLESEGCDSHDAGANTATYWLGPKWIKERVMFTLEYCKTFVMTGFEIRNGHNNGGME